jgi:hypothetical protein
VPNATRKARALVAQLSATDIQAVRTNMHCMHASCGLRPLPMLKHSKQEDTSADCSSQIGLYLHVTSIPDNIYSNST